MSFRAGVLLLAVLAVPWWGCKGNINEHHPVVAVTTRVSESAAGGEALGGGSLGCVVTPNGRYVAFTSLSTNLIPGGTNGFGQIFRKDLVTGDILLVSQSTLGVEGNGDSVAPSISDNGRWIAFASTADNLLDALSDGNFNSDIFVRDVVAGTTIRVSVVDGSGAEGGSVPTIIGCADPVISGDGSFVVFSSDFTDLWSAPLSGNFTQVFRHANSTTGPTDLVSVSDAGVEPDNLGGSPSISRDGAIVAFASDATDLLSSPTTLGVRHVFLRDYSPTIPTIELVSVTGTGVEGDNSSDLPSISADGSRIAFQSLATNLDNQLTPTGYDVFLHVRGGPTRMIARDAAGVPALGDSRAPGISADGRFVAFVSGATNLVPGDLNGSIDVFWVDTSTGVVLRVSVRTDGGEANDDSDSVPRPAITGDGRLVVFNSLATNLVVSDSNGVSDVFAHGPLY